MNPAPAFAHEALLYADDEEFLEGTVPFVREGLEAAEPILAVLPRERIALLGAVLGADARRVAFVDMTRLGRNPARIIGAWRDFLSEHDAARRPVRGLGEPVWAGRSAEEIVECQHHESLLNLAFDGGPPWRLLCPYDVSALEPEVIARAGRSHPVLREHGAFRPSPAYVPPACALPAETDLPEPCGPVERMAFGREEIGEVRRAVSRLAIESGFDVSRASDFMLAVGEIANNSVLYGGGVGTVSIWHQPGLVVCEVRDAGRIADPLAGRSRPAPGQRGGYGLWLANEVCDLVQMRSAATGSVVRLQLRAD